MRGATGVLVCAALAACGKPATVRAPADDPKPTEEAHAPAFEVSSIEGESVLLRDGDHLYWIDARGVHRRRLGGEEAATPELLTGETAEWPTFVAMDVSGGVVAVTDGEGVYVLRPGTRTLEAVATDVGGISDVAVGPKDIAIARTDAILRVSLDGGTVQTLASGQTRVAGLDVGADHVYWTDAGTHDVVTPSADATIVGVGAVRRVPLAGGKVQTIARGQAGPVQVVVRGDRVWWCDSAGPAVQSAKLEGGDVRTEVEGV
jgi:hypothetical protein